MPVLKNCISKQTACAWHEIIYHVRKKGCVPASPIFVVLLWRLLLSKGNLSLQKSANRQENHNLVTPSLQNHNLVTPSLQNHNLVTPSLQNHNLVNQKSDFQVASNPCPDKIHICLSQRSALTDCANETS